MTKLAAAFLAIALLAPAGAVAGAGGGKGNYNQDLKKFKQKASTAHQQILLYEDATELMLTACDSADQTEANEGPEAGAAARAGVAFGARANLDFIGASALRAEAELLDRIRAFLPWRGPGKFDNQAREDFFGDMVRLLKRDVLNQIVSGTEQLDLSNEAMIAGDCGTARTHFANGLKELALGRKLIGYWSGKITKFVKKWAK